jgi:lipoate-protein ligase A
LAPGAGLIYPEGVSTVMARWRLLDTPPATAAENMALDECILRARSENRVPDTLRFMQLRPRAVLLGYHQSPEQEVRVDYCRRNGIDINRRITGGGALFFDESQLGWEVFAARSAPDIPGNVEKLYRKMCECTVLGLRKLGIDANFRPRNDIVVRGRKISGTGGTFEGDAFLFQGTLLVDFDASTMLRALRIPIEKLKDKEVRAISKRVTWLSEELGKAPPLGRIKKALADGFAESLGIEFEKGSLTDWEKKVFKRTLPRFRSEDWVWSIRRPPEGRVVLKSAYRSRGGLIRATVVADIPNKRIHYVLISGDFFAFPRDSIMNLEARLKDAPLDRKKVASIIERFFSEEKVRIPFAGPADFIKVMEEALKKTGWGNYGIPPEDVNCVFPVVLPLESLRDCTVVLLPYCAKPLDCGFRNKDGCASCGRCDTGGIYELAQERGLVPVSITSYAHLERTLKALKRGGVKGFIGSCCEAFYIKHREDFERIGVPGVLVDIDSSTCYDIYKDAEAHAGKFDRQTELRTELFRKVIDGFSAKRRSRKPRQ